MHSKPLLVLFLSTGNAVRSIAAEAILNAKASNLFRARSAGMMPAEQVDEDLRYLLESAGLETQKLHPKNWEDFYVHGNVVPVDIIVTLSPEAAALCPTDWPGNPMRVHWNVEDPAAAPRADIKEWKLRKCLATLDARISMLSRCRPTLSPCEMLLRFKEAGRVV